MILVCICNSEVILINIHSLDGKKYWLFKHDELLKYGQSLIFLRFNKQAGIHLVHIYTNTLRQLLENMPFCLAAFWCFKNPARAISKKKKKKTPVWSFLASQSQCCFCFGLFPALYPLLWLYDTDRPLETVSVLAFTLSTPHTANLFFEKKKEEESTVEPCRQAPAVFSQIQSYWAVIKAEDDACFCFLVKWIFQNVRNISSKRWGTGMPLSCIITSALDWAAWMAWYQELGMVHHRLKAYHFICLT